jgi:outer membrane receptor for ferrienterochelin and colicins
MPPTKTARGATALLACLLTASLTLPVLTRAAHADGVADEAELQFQRGADAYRKGDFTGALEHFLASNRLARNRNVMFNIARAYEQLQRFPDAYRYYVDALDGEDDAATRKTVEAAIGRVTPMVAVIAVETTPPGATIYIDRKDLGSVGTTPTRLGLAAGHYVILVELAGYEPASSRPLDVTVGSTTKLALPLRRVIGSVRIEGEAGTAVRVDDDTAAPSCQSPCQLDLPPGVHTLYFGRAGFASQPRTVHVVAHETLAVKASLSPLTGSVLVAADEPNALVEIDGKPVGFAPSVVPNVAVGKRTVRISLHGYVPVEREVVVEADRQVDLRDVVLLPIRQIAAASRSEESVDDAPASVTVLSAQELEAFGYPTLLEALRGVRGFALSYDSTYGNASVRGLGRSNDFSNRLLVLGDGAVLNEDILYQPFIHYDGRVDLGDVERVEIVRGPGSVLYGTGAVSGVINLVTRGRDEPTHVDVGISSADDAVARGRAAFTLRLGKDSGLWASLAGAHSQGRTVELGFVDEGATRETPHPVHDFDRFDAWTFAGRFWHRDLTLQWFYTWRHLIIPTGGYESEFDRPENTYDDRRGLAELRYEPHLGAHAQLLARAYFNTSYFGSDFLYEGTTDPEGMPVTPFDQIIKEVYKGTWGGAELRAIIDATRNFRLSVGGEVARHFQVELHSDQGEVDGSSTNLLDVSAPYTVLAGYASLEWRIVPALKLVAGARIDRWDLSQDALGFTGRPLTADFNSINPRVALIWHASSSDIVKLMGGRAFRAPSTYEYFYTDGFYTQATSDCCSTKPLAPETVYSAEVENIYRFDRDWALIGSAYGIYAKDIIETVPVPPEVVQMYDWPDGIFYYKNSKVGQQVLGGDVELRREWRGGSMLSASYGFQSSRYTRSPHENSEDYLPEKRVPNQPSHLASLRAVVPLVANAMSGGVRLSLEGPRRIALDSTDETSAAVIADVVLSGTMVRQSVRWSAGVYNLFDWRYALPAEPYASRVMPQLGRSLMLSLTLSR